MLQWQVCNTDCPPFYDMKHAVACSGLPVQVVYESQPRPDISLYVAPLGGQAEDAVMTLNAQAGKSNVLNDATCMCIWKHLVVLSSLPEVWLVRQCFVPCSFFVAHLSC